MGEWFLRCPSGGEYSCLGHYTGGHGIKFTLHCDKIRTLKAPKDGGACVDAPLAHSKHSDAHMHKH